MALFGLLGETLSHSYSPRIHRLLGDYEYRLFEIPKHGLEDFLQRAPFDGLNVTIPYKTAVLPYCAALSETARSIGSVNTLLRRPDGTLFGDNTDAYGFSSLLAEGGISVQGKKVLVLGSGGASLTACHVLRQKGAASVVVISRQGENHYGNLDRHRDASILVNTTPLGMYPNNGKSPVDLCDFPACEVVVDLIYNPARTALMLQAESLGIPSFGGLSMLLYQAKGAAELFTGKPVADPKKALRSLQTELQNLILIGMPGCGKSTLGRILSQQLGRPFVDADVYLEERVGCSISELFAQEGEEGFRTREMEVLSELGRQSGLILATGGGCVTREENYPSLHQNGTIVFLERALTELDRSGRPLSQEADLEAMYAKRAPHYRRFADVCVANDAAPEQVANHLWEAVYETTHS